MRRVLVGIQMLIIKLKAIFLEMNLEVLHAFMMSVTKSTVGDVGTGKEGENCA